MRRRSQTRKKKDILELDWENYSNTQSCFLDGRYFAVVFKNYSNVSQEPMIVTINDDGVNISMPKGNYEYVRVVMNIGDQIKHSCLLIIKGNKLMLFNPIESEYGDKWMVIAEMIQSFLLLRNGSIKLCIETIITDEDNTQRGCMKSGFCNAHVIRRVVAEMLDEPYDASNIKKYAAMIEKNYTLPRGEVEEEMTTAREAAIEGGIAGGAIGAGIGAYFGGGGALLGGAIGAGVGGIAGGVGEWMYGNPTTKPSKTPRTPSRRKTKS